MIRKILTLFMLTMVIATSAKRLHGTVVERYTGSPLSGVVAYLTDGGYNVLDETVSDENGDYFFDIITTEERKSVDSYFIKIESPYDYVYQNYIFNVTSEEVELCELLPRNVIVNISGHVFSSRSSKAVPNEEVRVYYMYNPYDEPEFGIPYMYQSELLVSVITDGGGYYDCEFDSNVEGKLLGGIKSYYQMNVNNELSYYIGYPWRRDVVDNSDIYSVSVNGDGKIVLNIYADLYVDDSQVVGEDAALVDNIGNVGTAFGKTLETYTLGGHKVPSGYRVGNISIINGKKYINN